jgi:regulator of cell morphogenesis and NO signaling
MTTIHEKLDLNQASVADVALTFPHALGILSQYKLDYCCGGKRLFVDACEKAGLDAESVWNEIQIADVNSASDGRIRFDTWDAPLLVDFIVQHHHEYVREAIPRIQELLDKVCIVHQEDSPFLLKVRQDFSELSDELMSHMPKEEEILFPIIKRRFSKIASADTLNLQAPITVMEEEHERAGELIRSIRTLTGSYNPPVYACPTFKMTYIMLEQFDKDLMQHIHLENNILFPKVTAGK